MYPQEQKSDKELERQSKFQSYYAIVFGRDGNKSIRRVLDSLLAQTVPPAKIMIIDDGSSDGMYQTVLEYEKKFPQIVNVQQTNNKTRDYTRLPLLWNMGILPDYDYHVIVPSDASFVPNYSERILMEFAKNTDLVICSGDWGPMNAKAPHGGGRFVKQSFYLKNYPSGYPHILGYESEILERALMEKPSSIKVLNDVEIFHHDALGHSHNFKEFGYGMKCLGYYPLYAIFRIGWDFLTNKTVGKRGALRIFRYYLFFTPATTGYYSRFPEDIRKRVRARQKKMLREMLGQAMKKIWRLNPLATKR